MSKIKAAFAGAARHFIPFVTCGDPSLDVTEQIVYAMADAGAGTHRAGHPVLRPDRRGPVIQEANVRALSAGTTTDKIFDMVRRIRQKDRHSDGVYDLCERGVLLRLGAVSSALPLRSAWTVSFCRTFRSRKRPSLTRCAASTVLDLVSLIAPTSHDRIRMIAKEASGFVYCVSSLGVTGVRSSITTDIGAMVKLVKEAQDIPCAVGFGISTPEQAAKDGRPVGRRDRRLGNRQALRKVRQATACRTSRSTSRA